MRFSARPLQSLLAAKYPTIRPACRFLRGPAFAGSPRFQQPARSPTSLRRGDLPEPPVTPRSRTHGPRRSAPLRASARRPDSRSAAPVPVGPFPAPTEMRGRDWLLIFGVAPVHLLTFIAKPAHIDDTLYLETARGILADPLHPMINSYHWEMFPRPIYAFAVN